MVLRRNKHSFISGDRRFITTEPVHVTGNRVEESVTFQSSHEGFIGIPHGGLAMGLCMDYFLRMSDLAYPVKIDFRFGGTGIFVGDPALIVVEKEPGHGRGAKISIIKDGDKKPYLQAGFSESRFSETGSSARPEIPASFKGLPYYKNCFVCGHERSEPGLERRFRYHEDSPYKETTVTWGEDEKDFQRADDFLIGPGELHPAVLLSIFDENTGWAGFMSNSAAGLSVRISVELLRPVKKHERLLFIGCPAGIRGSAKSPRFFKATGEVLSIDNGAEPSMVATGSGEWIIMEKYTAQLRDNLFPRDDWTWIFPEK